MPDVEIHAEASARAELLVQDLGELLESPRWHSGRQRVSFVDIPTGRVFEFAPSSGQLSTYSTGIEPLGAALPWRGDSYLLVGAEGIWDWLPGTPANLWAPLPVQVDVVSNDALLHDGQVWVGRMDFQERTGRGSLWRVTPESATEVVRDLTLPNGLELGPDRTCLLFAESVARAIYRVPLAGRGLDLTNLQKFVDLPNWMPDGIARDAAGHLWVARWGEGTVTRLGSGGTPALDITVPTPQSTAVAFDPFGAMYITTGRENFSAEQIAADPVAGSLFIRPPAATHRGLRGSV